MKQTAVNWLIDQMLKQGYFEKDKPLTFTNLGHLQHQAEELEKQQIIDALTYGNKTELMASQKMFAEQYYSETYGSNDIDDHIPDVRKMIEISDDEIERIGESYRIFYNGKEGNGNLVHKHYLEGIKWYREQLKSRQ